jgi:TPR repeat protein
MLYLREVTELPSAPGLVFTRLAEEVLARKGRWGGEEEAAAWLEQAAARGDAAGMRRLAEIQIRYRWDAARVNRAQNLLVEAAMRLGDPQAMEDLDALFRCQVPDAPRLAEARLWADNYAATGHRAVEVTPADLPGLDPFMDPETLAAIQAQAMEGRPDSLARLAVRLQRDRILTDEGLRFWARRVSASENALEDFALFEYALAAGPGDRDLAVELMRRAYLNNGPTTALELGIVLTEYAGRDPAVGDEIIDLLTRAGNRGEGAAIRLIARHQAGQRSPQEIFADFATVIEERGDFLALMFAIPFVPTDRAQDYLDRAVAVMACGSKDVEELADAHAFLGQADMAMHWKRVGLSMEYGHSLSQLAVTDRQMGSYGRGAAPGPVEVMDRELAEGDLSARRALFALTADPDLPSYDSVRAAGYLLGALDGASADDEAWILHAFRTAAPAVRQAAEGQFDMRGLFARAAGRGDTVAMRELGLLLRDAPPADPAGAAQWLTKAAEAGDIPAMRELGMMRALGLAGPPDRAAALVWRRAATAGDAEAQRLVQLLEGPG